MKNQLLAKIKQKADRFSGKVQDVASRPFVKPLTKLYLKRSADADIAADRKAIKEIDRADVESSRFGGYTGKNTVRDRIAKRLSDKKNYYPK